MFKLSKEIHDIIANNMIKITLKDNKGNIVHGYFTPIDKLGKWSETPNTFFSPMKLLHLYMKVDFY